nr:beta-galactosidase [bacterium]
MNTVYPKVIHDVLYNPGMGFQTMQNYDGDALRAVPKDRQQEVYYPKSTVSFFRNHWRQFEPQEGEYDFSAIDEMLAQSRRHGQTLYLRLMPYSEPPRDDIPDWLRARLG